MVRMDDGRRAPRVSRHAYLGAIAVLVALFMLVGSASRAFAHDGRDRSDHDRRDRYAIGLWGDMPYSDTQATVGVPNLIADMNSQDLAFTVHDGDLKSGSGPCPDSLYAQALGYFNSLEAPAIFTPGDNDWVDCDRAAGYNSLQQLDKERAIFFSTPFSLGQHKLKLQVQSTPSCLGYAGPDAYKDVACVENRRWTVGGVTYATLNVQGSCNNRCGVGADDNEWAARNDANIAWMQDTFAEAVKKHSAAVMFISQADPAFDNTDSKTDNQRDPVSLAQIDGQPDGFQQFLLALRDAVIAFGKPVAYVHGDSHYFRVDKPFLDAAGQRLENFTRVETFGDHQEHGNNDVNWLKVYVDSNSREVFSYQQQIVPANKVVAVP